MDIVTLKLEEFSLTNMEWLNPVEVKISLQRKPFAEGAFREAYMAKPIAGLRKGNYVLKNTRKAKNRESRCCLDQLKPTQGSQCS